MSDLATRRLEEKERRRAEIVEAAGTLAAERGWEKVTVNAVAKRARLSRALVYLYFKDKRELHAAIWEYANALLYRRFVAAAESRQRGLDQLEAIGRAYIAFAREFPHYMEAISRFEGSVPEDLSEGSSEQRAMRSNQLKQELMVAAVERGFKDGSIRPDVGDPRVVSVSLWGFTHGVIQLIATKGQQLARLGISEKALIEQTFVMLSRTLAPPGSG